jgi:hypothetical protein
MVICGLKLDNTRQRLPLTGPKMNDRTESGLDLQWNRKGHVRNSHRTGRPLAASSGEIWNIALKTDAMRGKQVPERRKER